MYRARDGDRAAFSLLAARHVERLDGVARLIVRDRDRAQDCVQLALVRAWEHLPSLREPERFGGWLQRLLVNACRDELRAAKRQTPLGDWDRGSHEEDPDRTYAGREELALAFEQLTADHRSVLVLRYHLGIEPTEIARTLGLPAGTVRARIHHGLKALRAAIEAGRREPVRPGVGERR